MSLHDEYARRTPLEIVFPDWAALEELSTEVGEEADRRGVDDTEPDGFMTMVSVAELVRELRGPGAPPESTYPLASVLYHGVHFLRAGARPYLLDREVTRRLVSTGAKRGTPRPPATAGYLQLPQHLLWTGAATRGTAPESIDGVFWTSSGSGRLHGLAVSGLLPDRPGFGALPLPGAPLSEASSWLDTTVRASGEDFASELPGGDLDRLYSVEAAGEILKLLARFFVLTEGEGVRLEARAGRPHGVGATPAVSPGAPQPSLLPYTRVSLDD